LVFPEGGRAAGGQLQPMAAGAAYIAIKAQVPLVPLTLIGTYELLPIHVYALATAAEADCGRADLDRRDDHARTPRR
jgi:hypothetical protein